MKTTILNRSKQYGFSLIEVLLGIFIVIGVLWVAVANYMEGGRSLAKVGAEDAFLSAAADCVRSQKTGPDFTTVSTQGLIDSSCMDKFGSINALRTTITNTYGGNLVVSSEDLNGLTDNIARFTITGYPQDGCNRLASGYHHKFAQITINAVVVKSPILNITSAAVAANCAAGANTILFDFG